MNPAISMLSRILLEVSESCVENVHKSDSVSCDNELYPAIEKVTLDSVSNDVWLPKLSCKYPGKVPQVTILSTAGKSGSAAVNLPSSQRVLRETHNAISVADIPLHAVKVNGQDEDVAEVKNTEHTPELF